jgi:hypothetical protein
MPRYWHGSSLQLALRCRQEVRHMNRWLSAFFIIWLLTASAEALDEADRNRMSNLVGKAIQLQGDMLNVRRGSPQGGQAWEC